jgi:hypothetical protein
MLGAVARPASALQAATFVNPPVGINRDYRSGLTESAVSYRRTDNLSNWPANTFNATASFWMRWSSAAFGSMRPNIDGINLIQCINAPGSI